MMIGFSRVKNGSAVTLPSRRSVQPRLSSLSCGNHVAVNFAFWKKPLRASGGMSDAQVPCLRRRRIDRWLKRHAGHDTGAGTVRWCPRIRDTVATPGRRLVQTVGGDGSGTGLASVYAWPAGGAGVMTTGGAGASSVG